MTKSVEIKWLIEVLDWIGQKLDDIANKPTVEINNGDTPTDTANTISVGGTTYGIGGGGNYTIEVLAGDMTATYTGSTPSYALPTTNTSLPSGKHFSDYDEICIVSISQQTASSAVPRAYWYERIPAWALEHCEGDYGVTVCTLTSYNGSAGSGTRVCLFPDDKYRNDWYNYASPIAILGIKY